jgi:acid stress chaperone HdeB
MKKNLPALIALAAALFLPAAQAATVDLGKLTCNELLETAGEDEDAASYIIIWIDGYLAGVTGDTRFNDVGVGQFTEKLVNACGRSPDAKVLDIAKSVGIE